MEEKVEKKNETISIVGFILSFFLPLVSFVICIIGLSRSKKHNASPLLAIIGLIISTIRILFRILLIGGLLIVFKTAGLSVKEILDDSARKMCYQTQECTKVSDDYYYCSYQSKNVNYKLPCKKGWIKDSLKEDADINEKSADLSLSDIEKLALKYYEMKTDKVLGKAVAKRIENSKIEISLYENATGGNEAVEVYTVDKDSLIGKNQVSEYVDLTEAIGNKV